MRLQAKTYQSILKYLEPKAEMKVAWRSAQDLATSCLTNISNTIRSEYFNCSLIILMMHSILMMFVFEKS